MKRSPTRFIVAALAGLALVGGLSPANAQAPQMSEADVELAPIVVGAVDLCLAHSSDLPALQQAARSAGWPEFRLREGVRDWMISNRALAGAGHGAAPATLAVANDGFPPAPTPTQIFSCKIVVAESAEALLRAALEARFGAEFDGGFFIMSNGGVRPITYDEAGDRDFPEILSVLAPGQGLAVVTTTPAGAVLSADIDIFRLL